MIEIEITEEGKQEIVSAIETLLYERFDNNEFVFGPIVMFRRTDYYGDEYLHIYIVYEGDRANLDPKWTGGLIGMIRPKLRELGIQGIPCCSFVTKLGWKEVHLEGTMYREPV